MVTFNGLFILMSEQENADLSIVGLVRKCFIFIEESSAVILQIECDMI